MELFKKIKNRLGMLALFELLFQIIMPLYQTYVFAEENEAATEQVGQEAPAEDAEVPAEDAETPVEDAKTPTEDAETRTDEAPAEAEDEETPSEDTEAPPMATFGYREPQKITENIITSAKLTYKDGTEFIEGDLLTFDDDLKFELTWALPNEVDYVSGDYFEFQLPEQLKVYNELLNQPLGDEGIFNVDLDGKVTFIFDETVEGESDIHGNFKFYTTLDKKTVKSTDETIVIVLSDGVEKIIKVNVKPTGGQSLTKTGEAIGGNYNIKEIEWTLFVNTKKDLLKNAFINDPILAEQELILDSINL